jgi:hypothetical protein
MAIEFPCDGCGRFLRVGVESEGQQVRCPGCGTVSIAAQMANAGEPLDEEEIPVAEEAEEEPFQARLANIDRAIADINRRSGPRSRRSDAAMVKDGPCPNCRKPMKAGDVLCIECGFDLRKGKTRAVKVKQFERNWLGGLPIWGMALIGSGILSEFALIGLVLLASHGLIVLVLAPVAFLCGLPVLALTGWFTVLHLSRDQQGTLWLRLRKHFAFIPYAFEDLAIKDFKAVVIGYRGGMDWRKRSIAALVILPHVILMPVILVILFRALFRIVLVQHHSEANSGVDGGLFGETYWLSLRDKRRREVLIYYGGNHGIMQDIVDALSDAGGLEIVR